MISIIIPTYQAENEIEALIEKCLKTRSDGYEILVVDSSSDDNTTTIAQTMGARVEVIPKAEFRHGATRTLAGRMTKGDIVVFMTQDVVLFDDSIDRLVEAFRDPDVVVVYGRQLPKPDADPLASHLRYFNYPEVSQVRSIVDKDKLGFKVAFNSDSFAAYRRSFMDSIGWFGVVDFAEDSYAASKAILAGKKVAYVAQAKVLHSHNYGVGATYRRYVEVGKAYGTAAWITDNFGKPTGEGVKYVLSEWKYLLKRLKFGWWVKSCFVTLAKFLGYRKGGKLAKKG